MLRVLVIDDEPGVHSAFKRILSRSVTVDKLGRRRSIPIRLEKNLSTLPRFEVDSAYRGEEGLERVKDSIREGRPYMVVFVDVRMPGNWDGIETIKQIWRVEPGIHVVVSTGFQDYTWEQLIDKLGNSDRLLVLMKPFEPIEVRQTTYMLYQKWLFNQHMQKRFDKLEGMVRERTRELETANQSLRKEMQSRQNMEVELRHAQKLESVGQLAAGIAHEINTPIQFVRDSIHFIQDSFESMQSLLSDYRKIIDRFHPDDEVKQALFAAEQRADLSYLNEHVPKAIERTLEGAGRVADIVLAMKEFAHPHQIEKKPSDINKAIANTLIVARNEYKYVAEIESELGDIPPVVCHIGDINQVLLNIIVNAAHAIAEVVGDSGEKGTIRIRSMHKGSVVVISITDTGCGILENIQDRIFDPFFTTKEVGLGTGQGLAIARSIVSDKHGGSITFESIPGKGSTFFIRLPVDGKL